MLEGLEDRIVPSTTLLTETTTVDYDNDGTVDLMEITSESFDKRGNLLSGMRVTDLDGDGTTDSIFSITQSYDRHGNVLSSVTVFDFNADGTADSINSTTQSFDRHGNLLYSVTVNDSDGNGAADSIDSTAERRDNLVRPKATRDHEHVRKLLRDCVPPRATQHSCGGRPSELEVPETEMAAAVCCHAWIPILSP